MHIITWVRGQYDHIIAQVYGRIPLARGLEKFFTNVCKIIAPHRPLFYALRFYHLIIPVKWLHTQPRGISQHFLSKTQRRKSMNTVKQLAVCMAQESI